jgi:hypothetical protein
MPWATPIAMEAQVRNDRRRAPPPALFRRLDAMMEGDMPPGHVITANPNAVVRVVLGCSSWAVLALSLFVERFSQVHYRASVEAGEAICPLWRDVSCSTGERSRSTQSRT